MKRAAQTNTVSGQSSGVRKRRRKLPADNTSHFGGITHGDNELCKTETTSVSHGDELSTCLVPLFGGENNNRSESLSLDESDADFGERSAGSNHVSSESPNPLKIDSYTAEEFEEELRGLVAGNKVLPCFVVDHSSRDIDEWQSIVMRFHESSCGRGEDAVANRISIYKNVWQEWLGTQNVQSRAQRKHPTQFTTDDWTAVAENTRLVRFRSPFSRPTRECDQLYWTAVVVCVPEGSVHSLRQNVLLRCALLHASLQQTSRFLYMGRQEQLHAATTFREECSASSNGRDDSSFQNSAAFCSARNSNARHFIERSWKVLFPRSRNACFMSTYQDIAADWRQTSLDRVFDHLNLAFITAEHGIDVTLLNDIVREIRSRQREEQSAQRSEENSNEPAARSILVDTPFESQIDLHKLALILVQYHHLSNETQQQREASSSVPIRHASRPASLERRLNEFLSAIQTVRRSSENAALQGRFREKHHKKPEEPDEPADKDDPHCVVCLVNKAKYAVVPCGHLCMCNGCRIDHQNTQCPVCKGNLVNTVRIFIAL